MYKYHNFIIVHIKKSQCNTHVINEFNLEELFYCEQFFLFMIINKLFV